MQVSLLPIMFLTNEFSKPQGTEPVPRSIFGQKKLRTIRKTNGRVDIPHGVFMRAIQHAHPHVLRQLYTSAQEAAVRDVATRRPSNTFAIRSNCETFRAVCR